MRTLLILALVPGLSQTSGEEAKFQGIADYYFSSGLDRAKPALLETALRARVMTRLLDGLRREALPLDRRIDLDILRRRTEEKAALFELENGPLPAPFSADAAEQAMAAFPDDPDAVGAALGGLAAALRKAPVPRMNAGLRAQLAGAVDHSAARSRELRDLLERDYAGQKAFLAGAADYLDALAAFKRRLLALEPEATGPPAPSARDRYAHALRYSLLTDHTPESLLFTAMKHYRATLRELEACARKIDPAKTWQDLIEDCKENDRFAKDEYFEKTKALALQARDYVLEKDLVTIPESARDIRVVKGRSPTAAFGNYSGSYVTAMLDGLDEEKLAERLRDNHRHWTALVALHEAVPGHHLQFSVARSLKPSAVRKLGSTPAYVEGWGLYCEDMMYRNGYFADGTKMRLNALKMRLWRCARALIDEGLQTGTMTKAQAVDLLVREVTLEPLSARLEVDNYAARPTYFSGYLVGYLGLTALRAEAERTLGARFDQKKFHDAVLGAGPMPIPQLREAVLDRLMQAR
jgi:uncharacterized protein (DUF885 family)